MRGIVRGPNSANPARTARPAKGRPTYLPASLFSGLIVGVILCLLSPGARAQGKGEPREQGASATPSPEVLDLARRHYESGKLYYEEANYRRAREEFEEAYRLSHLPDLLFNLSRAAERMNQPQDAQWYLESYLREQPNAPDRKTIQAEIERLRLQAASRQKAPPSSWPPWPALALLGGGTGVLLIGIGLGGGALAAARSVSDPANNNKPFGPDLQATQSRGQALSAAGIALDVVGALALGAGCAWTGLWFSEKRRGQGRASLSVTPLGLGLGLSGSF